MLFFAVLWIFWSWLAILGVFIMDSRSAIKRIFLFRYSVFLIFVGSALNYFVRIANGLKMPVDSLIISPDKEHQVLTSRSALIFLADVMNYHGESYSLGDLVVALGLAVACAGLIAVAFDYFHKD